jgi:hypothetical protein
MTLSAGLLATALCIGTPESADAQSLGSPQSIGVQGGGVQQADSFRHGRIGSPDNGPFELAAVIAVLAVISGGAAYLARQDLIASSKLREPEREK